MYAENYDALCDANPAYTANLETFGARLTNLDLPENPVICDVGAGTGNYLLKVGKLLPDAELHHIDFDTSMTNLAVQKYKKEGLDVVVHQGDARYLDFPIAKFDLVICVNTIYSIPEHGMVLRTMRNWTKSGGKLYIIDFGRQVELLDWALYILRNRVKELGLRETIRWYRENSENLRQNRRGAKAQADGFYWLHSTEEFKANLLAAGWHVNLLETCYRDCCDLALAVNPPEPESPPEHQAQPTQ